jgi:hypothetical protein
VSSLRLLKKNNHRPQIYIVNISISIIIIRRVTLLTNTGAKIMGTVIQQRTANY